MDTSPLLVIGLTGGIGCGKSTVAEQFARLGVHVVDTDLLAHSLSAPGGRAIAPLRAAFGDAYITPEGALDRARMRKLVFGDDSQRRRLESILHPLIREQSQIALAAAQSAYALLVIPLLFESGNWKERVARALVVDCPIELQIERVIARSKMERAEVEAIMARQVSRNERLRLADDVIDNSGPQSSLAERVAQLDQSYLDLAHGKSGL